MPDAFISYSRTDSTQAEQLATFLLERGLSVWLDKANLRIGVDWRETIERDMNLSGACLVLWGATGLGRTQREERSLAYAIRDSRADFKVVNVLLPGATRPEGTWANIDSWVDFSKGFNESLLDALNSELRGEAPSHQFEITLPDKPEPYPGLSSFELSQTRFFFGRTLFVEKLIQAFERSNFVAIAGPSGSGKTSAIQAGMFPKIGTNWRCIILQPGEFPVRALALQAGRLMRGVNGLAFADDYERRIRTDPKAICEIVEAGLEGDEKLLILLDRLEELFTLTYERKDGQIFAAALKRLAEHKGIRIVATMRSEFYSRMGMYPDAAELVSRNQIFITPLQPQDVNDVIEMPALEVGALFEKGLAEQVAIDAGKEQEVPLPLLQLALQLLWKNRRGRWLTWDAYRKIRGVAGVLAYHADGVMGNLSPAETATAERLLCRMVWLGDPPEQRSTRRISLPALIDESPDPAAALSCLTCLQNTRLVVVKTDGALTTAELIHDSLTMKWEWLDAALKRDIDFLVWRQNLDRTVTEWGRVNHDSSLLLRGIQLNKARSWLDRRRNDLDLSEKRFIAQSIIDDEFTMWRSFMATAFGRWIGSGNSASALLTGADLEVSLRWGKERPADLTQNECQLLVLSLAARLSEYYRKLRAHAQRIESKRARIAMERRLWQGLKIATGVALTVVAGWLFWKFWWTHRDTYQVDRISQTMKLPDNPAPACIKAFVRLKGIPPKEEVSNLGIIQPQQLLALAEIDDFGRARLIREAFDLAKTSKTFSDLIAVRKAAEMNHLQDLANDSAAAIADAWHSLAVTDPHNAFLVADEAGIPQKEQAEIWSRLLPKYKTAMLETKIPKEANLTIVFQYASFRRLPDTLSFLYFLTKSHRNEEAFQLLKQHSQQVATLEPNQSPTFRPYFSEVFQALSPEYHPQMAGMISKFPKESRTEARIAIIEGLSKSSLPDPASRYLPEWNADSLHDNGIGGDLSFLWASIANAYGRAGNYTRALDLIRSVPQGFEQEDALSNLATIALQNRNCEPARTMLDRISNWYQPVLADNDKAELLARFAEVCTAPATLSAAQYARRSINAIRQPTTRGRGSDAVKIGIALARARENWAALDALDSATIPLEPRCEVYDAILSNMQSVRVHP